MKSQRIVPDYDGCVEWGALKNRMSYLTCHDRSGQTRWIPKLSDDAYEGKHAAILNPEKTILPPILSTTGVPHRFSCFLKSAQPVAVTIELGDRTREVQVGTQWQETSLDFTPADSVMGSFPASVTIPKDAIVLVDAIKFRPIVSDR